MKLRGITQRWMLNSLGLIVAIILVFELGFAFIIQSNFYSSVKIQLAPPQAVISAAMISTGTSQRDFEKKAQEIVENFSDKERMELQILDREGKVVASSTGFNPTDVNMTDYNIAIRSKNDGAHEWQGRVNGENVMTSVTIITKGETDGNYGAFRLLVSLEKADQQTFLLVLVMIAVGIAILFFVIMSGSYFINSIVNPVREVGTTARRIALGDFDARIQKKYNDEIGDLCDTINYMASELSTTEKMKNDFISSVSHELRTPLTAIKGWGETIVGMGGRDPQMVKKGLDVIINESERLSTIVEELLDFSKIQNGRLAMQMEKIDILAELGEAVFMFKDRAVREDKELVYHEPEILSAVLGDRNRLKQVFVNILDNAFKYSDPGGRIRVEAYDAGENENNIQVVISDNGCGISETDLPKVKEKFYKANSTRRGSGIGLAVVDEIITMHGGSITIESKEDVGTDVIIILPSVIRTEESEPPAEL